jgi:hypothetical protein
MEIIERTRQKLIEALSLAEGVLLCPPSASPITKTAKLRVEN